MRNVLFLMAALLMSQSIHADEILFNTTTKRSVLDMATAPDLKVWERSTYLDELCFKNASAEVAHQEMLDFRDMEILFDFDTESYVESSVYKNEIYVSALNGKMMDDGLTEEEATLEYEIFACEF
jgi:hypothetical protein